MAERLTVAALAILTLLSLWVAPWAAINREVGARSTLLLLPNRIIDFTGRTEPLTFPGQGTTMLITITALALIAAAAVINRRRRYTLWFVSGLALIVVTATGLTSLSRAVSTARVSAFSEAVQRALERPRDNMDIPALEQIIAQAPERPLEASRTAARAAGVNVRRLPYNDAGIGLAAFLSITVGALAMLFSLRLSQRLSKLIDRMLAAAAVPATSILLSLLAAAVVVLALQPTPIGRDVEISGGFLALVGRLDTLWYAYQTLFADSLGTLGGFMESLKFSTPLIFTGLAVAFGFRAGLFNIGAPGQMVLGAIAAMLVGVYMPGPRVIVLPLAVLASAVGGGIWGAIPGWLKARFGANEVINTIMMNFIAASLLLFVLSSEQIFTASALRMITVIGLFALVALIVSIIAPLRAIFSRSPRIFLAVSGVALLALVIVFGLPRASDTAVDLNLNLKAPGLEAKSYPLSEASRLNQLPALAGIDLEETPGAQVVPINYALYLASLAALLALIFAPRLNKRLQGWGGRIIAAVVTGGVIYALAAAFGLSALDTLVPPAKLNTSFILALLTAVLMYYLMWRTKWGYELRAVGLAPKAAEYGGASIARNVILAMAISGAFAGLTATHYVLGGALEDYSLRQSLPTNDGFDGIAVALLGANTPVGVVLSAFLFGVLKNGGSVLNITFSGLTRDVVSMILALVVLFIAAKGFLPDSVTNPLRRRVEALGVLDPKDNAPIDAPGKPVRTSEERAKGD